MVVHRKRQFSQVADGSLQRLQLLEDSLWVQRVRASSLRFERLPAFNSREELREGDAQSIRNPDDGGQAEILSACLQVPNKGAMQLAVICKRFLRYKTSLDTDFANPLSESFQNVVHAKSVCEWLSNRLLLVQ